VGGSPFPLPLPRLLRGAHPSYNFFLGNLNDPAQSFGESLELRAFWRGLHVLR